MKWLFRLCVIIATWLTIEMLVIWWQTALSNSWAFTIHFDRWTPWWPWLDFVLYHAALVVILTLWGMIIYRRICRRK